jgi:hypothetical protein
VNEILHIHSQLLWHDDAWILGNRAALVALRDAVDAALRDGQSSITAFVSDGEGFVVNVVCREDIDAQAAVPYASSDEESREKRPDAVWPWERVDAETLKRLSRPETKIEE